MSVAIRSARTELYNHKERQAYFDQKIDLEDWLLPVVYQNQPQHLSVREFTPPEREDFFARQAALTRNAPPEPRYGFVGRDLDILQIEKYLLTRRNILLVRGMGGAGKTTLLRHLGAWWSSTGFVEQLFYFGYDTQAWSRQQIMVSIAQQVLGMAKYYSDFQPLSLDAQQAFLSQRLRAENHLLILDNLESITGAQLAIQHTLPQEERDALRSFLIDLAGGRTLVLLGSRGSEDWLARGTFDDNMYELGGLDPEAASVLAERILEKHDATKYRQDTKLLELLKVLDGFPLALEVVLPNLAHQNPKEVLEALQAGDVDLDTGNPEDKTKSILRCIDYSHSNLSPEAQQLLLCFAPFTSVIDQETLENYTTHLKQQPALASLPFERWPEVLREAANWGLLSPDPAMPRFLHLQPIFPYFLRNRLDTAELSPMRASVETAFRLHYDQLGEALYNLLKSKEPQERQVGQILVSLEYTNLSTALDLALAAQVPILKLYITLSKYADSKQEQQRGLRLGKSVLKRIEAYPSEKLTGIIGAEYVGVIGDVAKRHLNLKDHKEAKALYQKALDLHLKLTMFDVYELANCCASIYEQLGRVAQEQREWKQAESYCHQALQIYIECKDRDGQARAYIGLGVIAGEQREWGQAEICYQQALQIYIEHKDHDGQARAYYNLGVIAEEQREWGQAEICYQQALQIYIEHKDRYQQAGTYHNLGRVAHEKLELEQAEIYYQQALQIYIEYKDHYEQAKTYQDLGTLVLEKLELEQAEAYYQQALQIYIEYKDLYGQAKMYNNLGTVAQEKQEWAKAEVYYRQSLQIKIEYQGRYDQAGTSYNLGMVLHKKRDWEQAEAYYLQALQIFIEYNERCEQAKTCQQLGRMAQEQRQWEQARDYYLFALETCVDLIDAYNGILVLQNLAIMWLDSGDPKLPSAIAKILGMTPVEVENILRQLAGNNAEGQG